MVITTIEVEIEVAVEEEEEVEEVALEVAVVDIIINKTNLKRNLFLTQANIWIKKFVYDLMVVEKVKIVVYL